jgi:hypothetical protein
MLPLGRREIRTSKKGRELSFFISMVNWIWGGMIFRWLNKEMREGYP